VVLGRDELFQSIGAIVTVLGYECVNVALVSEDGRPVLRVMIDSLGGINVGDCEMTAKAINRWLDGKDAEEAVELSGKYYLEVSSPGLERPLFTPADYERFKNREARIKTHAMIGDRKIHIGFIRTSDEESVTLETEQGQETIPFSAVTRATLVYRGLEPQEPKKCSSVRKPDGKRKPKATEKT
jgi:ribosome maturation factor RimP